MIPQLITDAFPAIIPLLDSSRNAAGHVQTPESEISGMNKLFMEWSKLQKEGTPKEYQALVDAAIRSRPFWVGYAHHMVAFLARHSGGVEGLLWKKFHRIHSHYVPSDERRMPGRVIEVLANVTHARLAYCGLLTGYLCPADKGALVNKQCEWLKGPDLARLTPSIRKDPAQVAALDDANDFCMALETFVDNCGVFGVQVTAAQSDGVQVTADHSQGTHAAQVVDAEKKAELQKKAHADFHKNHLFPWQVFMQEAAGGKFR